MSRRFLTQRKSAAQFCAILRRALHTRVRYLLAAKTLHLGPQPRRPPPRARSVPSRKPSQAPMVVSTDPNVRVSRPRGRRTRKAGGVAGKSSIDKWARVVIAMSSHEN